MLASGAALAAPSKSAAERAYGSVDPFIARGEGHTYPGATVPFGMVQLSPDTRISHGKRPMAGQRATVTTTAASSVSRTRIFPARAFGPGRHPADAVHRQSRPGAWRSREAAQRLCLPLRHDDEKAEPGYYAVTLDDYKVRAELTTSTAWGCIAMRSPRHRRQGAAGHAHQHVRLPGQGAVVAVRVRADGTVTGFRETRGWAPGRQLYFAMRFSRPLAGHELHNTEQDIVYKGFPPPGEKDPAQRPRSKAAAGRHLQLRQAGRTAGGEGSHLAGQ